MTIIINTTVGESKGTARVWLEGRKLERAGFTAAAKYARVTKDGKLVLAASSEGRYKVSSKRGTPVIDITNALVEDLFGIGTKIKAVVRAGKVVIRRAAQAVKTHARESRVLRKLAEGKALTTASLFHGGGLLAKALHHGLQRTGIESRTAIASEIDSRYMDASLAANPELFTDRSIVIQGPVQDAEIPDNARVDLLEAGIPCTGSSTAGRAKGKLAHAEDHDAAGAMFFTTLQWVQTLQPAVVVFENVKTYQSTASMSVIRAMLSQMDYTVQEMVLNGCDYGALENRDRLAVVAVSRGLADLIDTDDLTPAPIADRYTRRVGDILEPISADDAQWRTFDYLVEKEKRDIDAGKGFRRQLVDAESTKIPTITREYQKARSTDPFLQHPTDATLSRLFTPAEHARIKGVPDGYVEAVGAAKTLMHEILGQSIVFPVFEALGRSIGAALRRALDAANDPVHVPSPRVVAA